ncbi:MAG: 3-deoxy-7-phosphoheptulonate synthase [Elusimicrobia bacterium CG03_land_8_20_14_0_80_50_18]|nr:MAG: 3-deoxy-7-phosphoheptulonate synthase [Elusimicrobia bacterium CG03_land_8_20_14_0_80_50_18]
MILTLKRDASESDIRRIEKKIKSYGFKAHYSKGAADITIGVIGENAILLKEFFEADPAVKHIVQISKPYKLAGRQVHPEDSVIRCGNKKIGGGTFSVMAGPCSVENRANLIKTAKMVKKHGAAFLRGGAFKPRTSPYSFQGLGEEGLKYLAEARKLTGLKIITEVMEISQIEIVAKYADIMQVGARNMQNFNLLRELGKINTPVMIKRGMAATISELLMAAEYVLSGGNQNVILCERGIRTFAQSTRFTLDISAVPALKKESHLPVIIDPSHSAGVREFVPSLCLAAAAAGADGIIVEAHHDPKNAFSDAAQTIDEKTFADIMKKLKPIANAVGRTI